MAEYPKGRGRFFAHRALRKMLKCCAAQEMGTTALALCMVIGHCEDAKRYTSYVTYFNDQLLSILGINKWDTLDRARRNAVAAGWLHYEARGKRQPGRYWILIPEHFQTLDDAPTDEGLYPENGDNNGETLSPIFGDSAGVIGGIKRGQCGVQSGDNMGDPSTLPLPLPVELRPSDACGALAPLSSFTGKDPSSLREEDPCATSKGSAKKGTKKIDDRADDVRAVLDHYRTHHERAIPNATSDCKEWRKIRQRLSEGFSVADLCGAIDGNHRSAFHCGDNDRQREYHGLELIMRDGDHVRQFLEVPLTPPPADPRRTIEVTNRYLEKIDRGEI